MAAHDSSVIITPLVVEQLEETQQAGKPGSDTYYATVCVEELRCLETSFDITSKGNGVLRFPGGWMRVYDMHQDENETPPGLFRNELIDVNGDGYLDIDSDVATFHFNPDIGCFEPEVDPIVPVTFGRSPCPQS